MKILRNKLFSEEGREKNKTSKVLDIAGNTALSAGALAAGSSLYHYGRRDKLIDSLSKVEKLKNINKDKLKEGIKKMGKTRSIKNLLEIKKSSSKAGKALADAIISQKSIKPLAYTSAGLLATGAGLKYLGEKRRNKNENKEN